MTLLGLLRRRRLPAALRPPLDRDERIVAWAGATDGEVVVATDRGVWLPGGAGRLGWNELHKATWSGRQLALVPAVEVAREPAFTVVEDGPTVVHTLLDPGNVPDQVRARVLKSIAHTAHHPLPGGGGVRVVARRVPRVDGLHWTVRYDAGVDPTDPAVRTVTGALVDQGRAAVGAGA